jgi:hypothetical protein
MESARNRNEQQAELKIWRYRDAPTSLRELAPNSCEWVVFIPSELVCPETEALFEHWETMAFSGNRYVLEDGSVLMTG